MGHITLYNVSVYGSLLMMLGLSVHAQLFRGNSSSSCFNIAVSRNFHLIKFLGYSYKGKKNLFVITLRLQS